MDQAIERNAVEHLSIVIMAAFPGRIKKVSECWLDATLLSTQSPTIDLVSFDSSIS